jgi:iron-sulfur cluster repair protein YtfE (RIC family)
MESQTAENVTRCLEVDHDRLDKVLLRAESAAIEGRFPQAYEHFAVFAAGLVRHMDAEEKVLFPALEEIEPRAEGPVSVMCEEHDDFRRWLEVTTSHLAAAHPGWRDALEKLKQGLAMHNVKEERVLYPMADDAARGWGGRDDLLRRLQTALEGSGL